MLWQWGRFYRSIYDMSATDRPSDDIIEDDGKLDSWFKWFEADQARRMGKARGTRVDSWEQRVPQFTGEPHGA